jgi:hypothetical protein
MTAAVALIAQSAPAATLEIKTGSWKKKIVVVSNGVAGEPMTLDACFAKKDLDSEAFLKDFPDKSCKWTKKEMSAKKLDVAFSCNAMSGVSVTEVKSPERVVVESTIEMTQGGKTTKIKSSEEWSWMGPDCKKGK